MNFFLEKISTLMITAVRNYRWNCVMVHRVRSSIPIAGRERDFYRAGSRLSSALLISATSRERISSANENLPKSRTRARACNCSGNDKADSVATSEVQRDAKTESEWEGKASFYGALNSDEVARPIYRRGGEGDPNYPGTDKQTADEGGGNTGEESRRG